MKDAVGSTMLVYIVIIVVGIVGSILIASNMYTSAYKAKNNIVSSIDKYYMVNGNTDCFGDNGTCTNSINGTLKNMGYHLNKDSLCNDKILNRVSKKAKDDEGNDVSMTSLAYEGNGYCIYRTNLYNGSYYYTVVTFSHLNINAFNIGSLFSTPVYGETRTYYDS